VLDEKEFLIPLEEADITRFFYNRTQKNKKKSKKKLKAKKLKK